MTRFILRLLQYLYADINLISACENAKQAKEKHAKSKLFTQPF
nr:MAG TPA: hypothetical protein [Caudoviricetes sp.]